MRACIRCVVPALAAFFAAGVAAAGPQEPYFYVTPFAGYTIFDGAFNFPTTYRLKNAANLGGRVGHQTTPWLGMEVAGGYSLSSEDVPGGQDVKFPLVSGGVTFTPVESGVVVPFVLIGAGRSWAVQGGNRLRQSNAEVGAGVRFWMNDVFGLRLEARDLMWLDRDNVATPRSHTWTVGGGVSYAIGTSPRDADGDGVVDARDKCLDTPHGAIVDATGCPIDADGDRVFDGLDECPATASGATVDGKGCPSDADGDGVFDGLDLCAGTPRGARTDSKGCSSDEDGDGVLDGLDGCPATPKDATVDERGCPKDSDGDGILDGLDQCPGTQAGLKVDKDGCTIEVTDRETELLDTGMIRLQNINFETGRAALLPESFPALDVVGQVLSKWPQLKIEIGGHCDSRGPLLYNLELSEARVNAVLEYLLKFPSLKREQYTTVGYGEGKPLVPNTSSLNMAKNRRVEFTVINTEVLRREVERRKMLKKN